MSLPLNIVKFFTPNYFFNLNPAISKNGALTLIIVFGLMVLSGIILIVIPKVKKIEPALINLFRRYANLLLNMGLVGWVLTLFRYEAAFFLSARFWLVVWFAGLVYWLVRILKYQFKYLPIAKDKFEKEKIFQKYLPKQK